VRKLPSAERVTQSYLARKPLTIRSFYADVGEIPGGWLIHRPGHVVVGKLGRERKEVFTNPQRLIEDFANSPDSPEAIVRFTKQYGVLHRNDVEFADTTGEGDLIETDDFFIQTEKWSLTQKQFRTDWEQVGRNNARLEQVAKEITPDSVPGRLLKAYLRPSRKGFYVQLQPDDLHGALWLAFVGYSDEARKCPNPTCDAPYFLATRRDQKLCSERCSRLVANRRWWADKGADWRKARSK
jgi:hypothetical protein